MVSRRNEITRHDAQLAAAVAAAAGVGAALADCHPTGDEVADVVLPFGLGALVAWLGASAPWWALLGSGAIVGAAAAAGGSLAWAVVGWSAMLAAGALGYLRLNQPAVRAAIAGAVVQVALRADWNPRFLASAAVAAVALALIAGAGWARRQRRVRRRVLWSMVGVLVLAGAASAALAVSAARVRGSTQDGYHSMLAALDALTDGDLEGADAALDAAAEQLDDAGRGLDGWAAQPSRFVPGVAQNRAVTAELANRGAEAARAAGVALDSVDLERLEIVDGVIDVHAVGDLAAPLAELERTVLDLREVLDEADNPWLVAPLADRLESVGDDVDRAAVQAIGSRAAAEVAPAMLGADGERRYLIAFTNPAEARAASGLMGNWSEVTIANGRIEQTATGRTNDLERGIDEAPPIHLDMPDEFFTRYGWMGAGAADNVPVGRKFWVNALVTPDVATVGEVYQQLYEATTGRTLDGVILMDPTALADLLGVTGAIDLTTVDVRLDQSNAVEFLTLTQYEYEEALREEVLAELTVRTLESVLSTTLPPPQRLGAALGPAATEGHLSIWAARPEEQRMLELVGVDAAMPRLAPGAGADALALTVNNAAGNKIDSFLERHVEYRPVKTAETGEVRAELTVTLTNTAPATGYSEYVIGNIVGAPPGTNRTMIEIWSALEITALQVGDEQIVVPNQREHGWYIAGTTLDIPPGGSVTIGAQLAGFTAPGDYALVYRPQPLPRPETLDLAATIDDAPPVEYSGEIVRRSIVSREGLTAWRPGDHPAW